MSDDQEKRPTNRGVPTMFAEDDARDLDHKSIMEARGYVYDAATGKWR